MTTYKVPHLGLRMVRERTLTLASNLCRGQADAVAIAEKMIGSLPTEHLIAILLDGGANVTGVTTLAQGGMHGCAIAAKDVLRSVLAGHAMAFVLAHNHPSNIPEPSADDRRFTRSIAAAAKIIGVPMVDHVVVTRSGGFRSMTAECEGSET